MSLTPSELLKDPLFQLNSLLWLTQPVPTDIEIKPLLHERGWTVYAIAQLLGPPLDVLLFAQRANISVQERVRPDVVLQQTPQRRFAFVECKTSSFGSSSTTADQARALLIVGGPRAAEVLGLSVSQVSESFVSYVLPDDQRKLLDPTLEALRKELGDKKIPVGNAILLGLQIAHNAVCIVVDPVGSASFDLPTGSTPFLTLEPDTDPRPVYFIPYDPDVDQTPQEKSFCKRILFERMLGAVVSAAGRVIPPFPTSLKTKSILNDSTFGMYDHWENQESAKNMRGVCKHFMGKVMQAVNSATPNSMSYQPGHGWLIQLQDRNHQERVLDTLTRFSCDTLDLQAEPPPSLFDEQEGV